MAKARDRRRLTIQHATLGLAEPVSGGANSGATRRRGRGLYKARGSGGSALGKRASERIKQYTGQRGGSARESPEAQALGNLLAISAKAGTVNPACRIPV